MKCKLINLIGSLFILTGCTATTPEREVQLPSQSLIQPLNNDKQAKLIVFNDSNKLMYGLDNSGKINIHLNGKGVGQLKIGEYVILSVEKGNNTIDLLHKDIVNFSSSHQIIVSESPTHLKIYAKVTSNGAEIVQKPNSFESKFKSAY